MQLITNGILNTDQLQLQLFHEKLPLELAFKKPTTAYFQKPHISPTTQFYAKIILEVGLGGSPIILIHHPVTFHKVQDDIFLPRGITAELQTITLKVVGSQLLV